MSTSVNPIIFISYAHADEPEKPAEGEVQWLSFVRKFLRPAVKDGIFDLWVDRDMVGGANWDPDIERKLRDCDIFILLVSTNSMASSYVVDKEIATIRERQAKGEDVYFYPLLLTPTPKAGLDKVNDKNLRPRDARPLSGFSVHDRMAHMTEVANEIAEIATKITRRKGASRPAAHAVPAYVHINGLPETAYERLVGRDDEMKKLDDVWSDRRANIVSLVAEGGAGKSALVNEWLHRLRLEDYSGAEIVLGWSFYSQGTKERATSAEEFLGWALDKLGITIRATSATAKGEAIAEAMMQRRVLLVLDGVEPLQQGPGPQVGQLRDLGLRALLRRFAATPPKQAHGLVVLTSRLAVKDIWGWRDGAAPVIEVGRLSDMAGAALLRDNGVWGTDEALRSAAHDFGGHALALGLLASLLKETQAGDVRRRDHVRAYLADGENPRHDHARRVMESYEREWLADHPVLQAMLHLVGLFDRPASGACLNALRAKPAIAGLTDVIVGLDDTEWRRSIAHLRELKLLAPFDPAAPNAVDAHALVREWFGERFRAKNIRAWRKAHGRLFDHLRESTNEGIFPRLEEFAPLYQAIGHGCQAGRHQEALDEVYVRRICRRYPNGAIEFYSVKKLGAIGSDIAVISWFFERPYEVPFKSLDHPSQSWVLSVGSYLLRSVGRLDQALFGMELGLRREVDVGDWRNATISSSNLSETNLLLGHTKSALAAAKKSIEYAAKGEDPFQIQFTRVRHATALFEAGHRSEAQALFLEAESLQKVRQVDNPILYGLQGVAYCDLLLDQGEWRAARDRAATTIELARSSDWLLDVALDNVTLGRSLTGLALKEPSSSALELIAAHFDDAVDGLRTAGVGAQLPRGLLARAGFYRVVGQWHDADRDLQEVEEIALPGPMRLFQCCVCLERARLSLAQVEDFAPLRQASKTLKSDVDGKIGTEWVAIAREQLGFAADHIEKCGYHRWDTDVANLRRVLRGACRYAELPQRV